MSVRRREDWSPIGTLERIGDSLQEICLRNLIFGSSSKIIVIDEDLMASI